MSIGGLVPGTACQLASTDVEIRWSAAGENLVPRHQLPMQRPILSLTKQYKLLHSEQLTIACYY